MSGALLMAASMPRSAAAGGGGGGGGGGGATVALSNRTVSKVGNGSISVSAIYTLKNDGTVRNHNNAILESWLLSGVAGDYEARATLQSGSTPTGTMGSWLALSSDRLWSLTAAPGATDLSTFLVEIRTVATGVVQASASITLSVQNTVL